MGRRTPGRIHWTLVVGTAAFVHATALTSTRAQGPVTAMEPVTSLPAAGQAQTAPATPLTITFSSPRPPRRFADMVMSEPADNPVTEAKAALGRRLFFDPVLSNDRSVSCATCHEPERAFTDDHTLAVGVFGRIGKRHSPSLVNRGFGRSHFWDGRSPTLEAQVVQPIVDPNEMDLSLEEAIGRLNADESYRTAFQSAFDRPISTADIGRALASYLRTIRSGDSPYDRFVAGDQGALSPEQQAGLKVFRTKGLCIVCHSEPMFTDEQFQNTGIAWRMDAEAGTGIYQDDGRFGVSSVERDRGKFKTPTLREVARTAPYMHDGSLATLSDVVDFYDRGGRANRNLFPLVRPIGLSAEEKQALIKFLESLSGAVTGK
jgi:cytochrome c peroxidase